MSDAVYFARREQKERALANAAMDPQIRAIHLTLADKYAELAGREAVAAELQPARTT